MGIVNMSGKKYKEFVRSRLFIKFILSYCVILAIPLVISGLLIFNSIAGSLSDEVKKNTRLRLNDTVDTINTRIREFNLIASHLVQNPEASPLFFYRGKDSISAYQEYKIMMELSKYKSTNSYIKEVSVLYPDVDTIIGSQGKQSIEEYLRIFYDDTNYNADSFRSIINSISDRNSTTISLGHTSGILKNLILYLKPLQMPDANLHAYVLVTIDSGAVEKLLLNSLGSYNGEAFLLDEKGDTITSAAQGGISIEEEKVRPYLGMENNSNSSGKIDGKNIIITFEKSEDHKWNFIVAMPVEQIFSKVDRLKLYSFIVLLISIFIGLLAAYYFAYGNYNPIRKLVDLLPVNLPGAPVVSKVYRDELDMIGDRLVETIYKDKKLQDRLTQYLPVVRLNFLTRLLKGGFSDASVMEETADFLGIKLAYKAYVVMIFNIDDYERFVKIHTGTVYGLYKFAVSNAVEELAQSVGAGYSAEDAEDRVTLIIGINETGNNIRELLNNIGSEAARFFERHFGFTLTVGIGTMYENIADIAKSYFEARTAVEYKMVKGKNRVILYEETQASREGKYYYQMHQQSKITNCIKTGDFEGVKQVLSDIIGKIKRKPVSMEFARCIYFETVNSAMKVLSELETGYPKEAGEGENILAELLKCETLDDLYTSTVEFYRNLCEYVNRLQERKETGFRTEILQYLEQNCSDSEMSLTHLADRFGVTISFMSRFIKNQTDISFVDYLHKLRVGKAKLLLLNSAKSINDISAECGYIDGKTFITTFKKYEGMTPGKYRDEYKDVQKLTPLKI